MRVNVMRFVLLSIVSTLFLLTGCGSGGSGESSTDYTVSGQIQKGPFAIGSQVTVNELDDRLSPTGKVYNVQTSDDLGNFAVASKIGKHLVEIVGDGFYMDELTGQLAASRIQLRAIVDLRVNSTPTVNILTSLQAQRLKKLIAQGLDYTTADTQSRNEVLAAFGINSSKISSLSTLYSMKINGSTDADSVLFATSAILSKMASNAAIANSTSQPAELANFINTIAAQIANSGSMTNSATTARDLAATQIDLPSVKTYVETYYANRGVILTAPKLEEWVDKDGSGILPRRSVPVNGVSFADATGVEPLQLTTSNEITVSGLGTDVVAPVSASSGTTILKNRVALSNSFTTVKDGDTLALRATSLNYGSIYSANIMIGSTSAAWRVTTKPLGGTISGLIGTGLVLQNNGTGNFAIPAGSTSFTLPASAASDTNYNISILTQPAAPVQVCEVRNGTGVVGSAPSNINIVCTTAQGFVYVGSSLNNPGIISAYAILPAGKLTSIGTFATDSNPQIAVDPAVRFAYVSGDSGEIVAYKINSATGALSYISAVAAGSGSSSITVDPTGKFVYVADYAGNVLAYSINSVTGALTPVGSVPVAGNPRFVKSDPTGKFVYSASSSAGIVTAFRINPATGTLIKMGDVASAWPNNLTIEPTGKFAYVASSLDVIVYSINATTGALTTIGTYDIGGVVDLVYTDPNGKYMFVLADIGDTGGRLASYSINPATGALTATGNFFDGLKRGPFVIDRTGNMMYFLDIFTGTIVVFNINTATGAFSKIGSYRTGPAARYIAVTQLP